MSLASIYEAVLILGGLGAVVLVAVDLVRITRDDTSNERSNS